LRSTAISWIGKLGKADLVAEIKWLHEFQATNRMEGDFLWGKFALNF